MTQKFEALKRAGDIAKVLHQDLAKFIQKGRDLIEIDKFIENRILEHQMTPAFKGFKGFPNTACVSVNNIVVHGIPYKYALEEGDIVSIDFGIKCDGWIVDTARTFPVGKISPEAQSLIDTADFALLEAIKVATVGHRIGDIGTTVENVVKTNGFYVLRDLTGHGVGRTLQEPPSIPNHSGTPGPLIEEGMVLAIEPIIAAKKCRLLVEDDDWSVSTEPSTLASHSEDTIYISPEGPINLTR